MRLSVYAVKIDLSLRDVPKICVVGPLIARLLATASITFILAFVAGCEDDASNNGDGDGGLTTRPLLSTDYLDDAATAMIEYAPIPGRPNEAIVASQSGLIYRVALDESFAPEEWGSLSDLVTFENEQGLLSVAFAPDFETSGRVYAYYTPGTPEPTILARFSASPEALDEDSIETLIEVEEFGPNHNGGHIAFDAEGYLYLSLGDGGLAEDPREKGQALDTLLGKVIRIDVSGKESYTIPPDNPFSDGDGPIREEIFAYGLRNPWRMTIDSETGDVWLGDVGQGHWEEVNRVTAGGNYGWDCREGDHEFGDSDHGTSQAPCDGDFVPPRAEYGRDEGKSVTGGVVYRGDDIPDLAGKYLYADFYTGRLWAVDTESDAPATKLMDLDWNIASFTLLPDSEAAIVTYEDGVHVLARE